jgi:hypothetical protein
MLALAKKTTPPTLLVFLLMCVPIFMLGRVMKLPMLMMRSSLWIVSIPHALACRLSTPLSLALPTWAARWLNHLPHSSSVLPLAHARYPYAFPSLWAARHSRRPMYQLLCLLMVRPCVMGNRPRTSLLSLLRHHLWCRRDALQLGSTRWLDR